MCIRDRHSISPSFSASRFCLIDRGITFAIAHVRGGGDLGDKHHEKGKKKFKKNTFLDYIACAKHLIEQRYTYKGGICFYGGSAGGLTGGAVANMAPDLFFGMLLLVPFVDTMTTMLNEKLPLTPGEWEMWGNPKKSKEYFEYILPMHLITIFIKKITRRCLLQHLCLTTESFTLSQLNILQNLERQKLITILNY